MNLFDADEVFKKGFLNTFVALEFFTKKITVKAISIFYRQEQKIFTF
jgi:hypothetical protein